MRLAVGILLGVAIGAAVLATVTTVVTEGRLAKQSRELHEVKAELAFVDAFTKAQTGVNSAQGKLNRVLFRSQMRVLKREFRTSRYLASSR